MTTHLKIDDISPEDKTKLDFTPIHKFVIEYGVPHPIANKLIGKTEEETTQNIETISNAIDEYVKKCTITIVENATKDVETFGLWNAPYGFKKSLNGELLEVPEEQRIINFVIKSRKRGLTITEICERLTRFGLKTRRNKSKWQTCVITRILNRKKEKGKRRE